MTSRALLVAVIAAGSTARADCPPEHAAMGHCTPELAPTAEAAPAPRVHVAASLGVIAATYRRELYEGDYQGTSLGASVAAGRFSLATSLALYRLVRNGLAQGGPGDVMVHAHASLVSRGRFAGGAMLMASLPTGDALRGLGMGHVMLMPELEASWTSRALTFSVSAGAGYAFGGADAHAAHGGGPIVTPMNARELAFGGGATYALASTLGVGVRVEAATPIGDGTARLTTGGRIVWTLGRAVTSAELAGGVLGDPFGLRALLSTTVRLR